MKADPTVAHLDCAVLQHSWPLDREMRETVRSATRICMMSDLKKTVARIDLYLVKRSQV